MLETVAAAGGGGIGGLAYAESADSSPRSSGGDFWDKPPFPSPTAGRLRLMCSYGGRIVPRPNSKSLCYLGGETRIVVVDRYSSLADLTTKLSRTLLGGCLFSLKYQLPNEDLDSLISVATEDDLSNMIEEYDRIIASAAAADSRTSRLRLFLFPSKIEVSPTSSVGSLLDDSKSDTWFVDALNRALGGMAIDCIPRGRSSDSSVNCLLGLEDDPSDNSHGGTATASAGGEQSERTKQLVLPHSDSSSKHDRPIQEVHSVPGSPMLDMASSFGSASSAPSLSSLPPLCLRPDDRPSEHRIADLDECSAQMNISASASAAGRQRPDDDLQESPYTPYLQPSVPSALSASSNSTATISSNDNPTRAFSSDDDKSNHIANQNLPLQPPTSTQLEIPFSDSSSRSRYLNITADPKLEPVFSLQSYHVPVMAADATGYPSPLTTEQFQHRQLLPQIHTQQQQQQYIPTNPHYIQQPGTGGLIPAPTFFPVASHTIIHQPPQTHHPYGSQIPLYYYYPVQQTPQYNLGTMQSGLGDPNLVSSAAIPALPARLVPPTSELPTSLHEAAATPQPPLIHLATDQPRSYTGIMYHVTQQQQLSQTPATIPKFDFEISAKHQPVSAGIISDAMMPVDAKVTRGF